MSYIHCTVEVGRSRREFIAGRARQYRSLAWVAELCSALCVNDENIAKEEEEEEQGAT